jgi:hypothetical protein
VAIKLNDKTVLHSTFKANILVNLPNETAHEGQSNDQHVGHKDFGDHTNIGKAVEGRTGPTDRTNLLRKEKNQFKHNRDPRISNSIQIKQDLYNVVDFPKRVQW